MCSNFPVEPVCPTWYSFCSGCFPWLLEAKCNHPNREWTMAKSYYGCFRKWCKLVLHIHTCNICLFTSIRSRTTLYLFKDIMFFLSNIILYVCIIVYLTNQLQKKKKKWLTKPKHCCSYNVAQCKSTGCTVPIYCARIHAFIINIYF